MSDADLSQETLINDTIRVLEYINEIFPDETIIVIGHSMGGSIATKTVAEIFKNEEKYPKLFEKIQGLIVIDVVEGTAMEALPYMESIVKSRPSNFDSIDHAVEYMYKTGTIKNVESARISVPPLFKEGVNEKGKPAFLWKTNLLSSQKYWPGKINYLFNFLEWFGGLTNCFLNIKVPKVLLLADSDRMDKDLTIAQMQGKFKLKVIRNVGHIIHEDDANGAYEVIEEFINTFRIPPLIADVKPIIGKLGSSNPKIIKYEQNKLDK